MANQTATKWKKWYAENRDAQVASAYERFRIKREAKDREWEASAEERNAEVPVLKARREMEAEKRKVLVRAEMRKVAK
jgi:hypothetical protein